MTAVLVASDQWRNYAAFTAVFVVALTTLYTLISKPKSTSKYNHPPKCDENFFQILNGFFSRRATFFLLDILRRKGKFVCLPMVPGKLYVLTGDYKTSRKVLEDTNSKKFLPLYQLLDSVATGETFFGREGHRATHVRKSVLPSFKDKALIAEVIEQCLDTWITQTLDPCVAAKETIDPAVEMQRVTASVICNFAFDYELSPSEMKVVLPALKLSFEEFFQNSARNPLRKRFGFCIPSVRLARQASKELFSVALRMLDAYRSNPNPTKNTLVANLVADPHYESDKQRARDMVVFLGAGYDTTSYTLSWALFEMARLPQEQAKLRRVLETKSVEDGRRCPELKNVVREVLRLNPAAALGGIRVTASDIVVDEMLIPKGSAVHIFLFGIFRDNSLFAEPDSFLPSRWEDPSQEQIRALIPFGLGKRNCPGQALANAELYTILHRLFLEYEFDVVEQGVGEFSVTWKNIGTVLRVRKV